MNHSFTDEQLLNLVNNTILTKTEFKLDDFTGGSVQITSTNNHQLIKYRVSLFFGYLNRNAISRTIDINEQLVFIWQEALLLKVKSMQISTNGMEYSELNELMNTSPSSNKVEVVSNKVVSKGSTTIVRTSYEVDAEEIANYLSSKILSENKNAKLNPNLWEKDIEKALRIDKRTKQDLLACIDWIYSPKGSFWIPNIMSGKKLREKYDQMYLKMNHSGSDNLSKREQSDKFIDDYFAQMQNQEIQDCEVLS